MQKGEQHGIGSLYSRTLGRGFRWFWNWPFRWGVVGAQVAALILFGAWSASSQTHTFAALDTVNPFTYTGTFTAQMNEYVTSLVNGLNPGAELHVDPLYVNFFNTEALTGGVAIPAGSAIINGVGVAGYVNSSCDSVGRSKCNGVGGFFRGRDVVNGSAVWGINPAALDMPGLTGHHITGSEIDLGVFGSPTFVRGEVIILGGVQTSYGTMPTDSVGLEIFAASPANLKWNRAIQVDRGASSLGQGLVLEGKLVGAVTVSHSVSFTGYDGAGGTVAHQASILADSAGNLSLQPSAGAAMAVLNSGAGLGFPGTTFASLGTPANGTLTFCSDCTIANPCAGAGNGAFGKRLNGVWVCN